MNTPIIISKKVRERRLRKMALWDAPGKTFTMYVHGWQTPNGHVLSVERGTPKPRHVAMTLNSYADPESVVRFQSEVFETRKEALAHVKAYYARQRAGTGSKLSAAYIVSTISVRKRKITTSPSNYTLATPDKIED